MREDEQFRRTAAEQMAIIVDGWRIGWSFFDTVMFLCGSEGFLEQAAMRCL